MKRRFFFTVALILTALVSQAGPAADKIKWNFTSKQVNDSTFNLIITAELAPGWHIFSFNPGGDGSMIPPDFTFNPNPAVRLLGEMKESGKLEQEDTKDVMGIINYYKGKVTYTRTAVVTRPTTLSGEIYFMVCDDQMCLPPESAEFNFKLNGKGSAATLNQTSGPAGSGDTAASQGGILGTGTLAPSGPDSLSGGGSAPNAEVAAADTSVIPSADIAEDGRKAGTMSLWEIFLKGLGAGFVAFITPCIYAMLPITVSFFTKRSKNKAVGLRNATVYSLSIIGIFALVGVLISALFSETTMYSISTSVGFNLFVFAIFLIFGISLLGAFEITLPASWSSKLDNKANASSIWGIFFMALVLVVVSFSCTSAFISWLIVEIVQSQNRLGGLIGFLGFGVAIALPFALFAFFPSMLNNIAKSGGWLNSVKVTMGFIELAMAMKFLSNVDLQYHWGLLDYEVYLAIWIVLFGLLGLYLLGKLRFSHDDELPKNIFGHPYLSVTRLFFAIAALSFTVYMIPGMFGAPLTGISGWLPERKTLEFNLHDNLIGIKNAQGGIGQQRDNGSMPVKYTDFLKSEIPGTIAYFDFEEALAASKKLNKPVLLDFTGHSCVNCRKMERAVLSKPEVVKALNEDFILASLYCDDRTQLAPEDQYENREGKTIKTLGAKNLDIEVNRYGEVGQPIYIFVDGDGNVLLNAGGYVPDVDRFLKLMKEAKARFHQVPAA